MDAPARVRPRWRIALAGALILPLGLLTRSGLPLPGPVRDYGGDTLYATLVFFLVALIWPLAPAWLLALLAFALCVAVEISQLLRAPWLEALRATAPGRLVLGAGFLWADLVCYAAGALLGWALFLICFPAARRSEQAGPRRAGAGRGRSR
jgi:hypothetical protein